MIWKPSKDNVNYNVDNIKWNTNMPNTIPINTIYESSYVGIDYLLTETGSIFNSLNTTVAGISKHVSSNTRIISDISNHVASNIKSISGLNKQVASNVTIISDISNQVANNIKSISGLNKQVAKYSNHF